MELIIKDTSAVIQGSIESGRTSGKIRYRKAIYTAIGEGIVQHQSTSKIWIERWTSYIESYDCLLIIILRYLPELREESWD